MATVGTYIAWIGPEGGDGIDLVNSAQRAAYILAERPRDFSAVDCGEAEYLPTPHAGPFVDPATDAAWWYDDRRAESTEFLGLMPVKVSGFAGDDISRTSTPTQTGISHGAVTEKGYTIVIEAVLVATTCCGAEFGLRALRQTLRANGTCNGYKLKFFTCVDDAGNAQYRTIANVAMSSDVEIVNTKGQGCGICGCTTLTTVRFSLRAAPGMWLDSVSLLATTFVLDEGTEEDIEEECPPDIWDCGEDDYPCPQYGDCDDPNVAIYDPRTFPLVRPTLPPTVAPGFSEPTIVNRWRTLLTPPTDISNTFPFELEPVIYSGVTALRNFQVRVWEKHPDYDADDAYYDDCNLVGGFTVLFMPKLSTLRRYACGNLVYITTPDLVSHRAERNLAGVAGKTYGGPIRMFGDRDYVIETRADPTYSASDLTMALFGAEVEP